MGEIADRLAAMTVRAESPDRNIRARLRGRADFAVEFRPHAFKRYRPDELEHQLATLVDLLWDRHERGVRTALALTGVTARAGSDAGRARELSRREAGLLAYGRSDSRRVRVKRIGRGNCVLRVEPDAITDLTETAFVAELRQALTTLTRDSRAARSRVREELRARTAH